MKCIPYFLLFIIVFLTIQCGGNSEYVQRIDAVFNQAASDISYENEGDIKPLDVGQWAVFKKNESGEQVLLKYSIFDKVDDKLWIEIVDLRKNKRLVIQYLIANYQSGDLSKVEFIDNKYKQDDREMTGVGGMFTRYLDPIFLGFNTETSGTNIEVPAGTFNNCSSKSGSSTLDVEVETEHVSISIHQTQSGSMFYHSAAPLNGLIGWNSTNDSAELVEFGFTGATSEY